MKKYKSGRNSLFFLQLAVSLFFLVLGLQGIIQSTTHVSQFVKEVAKIINPQSLNYGNVSLTLGVLNLLAGVFLFLGLFNMGGSSLVFISSLFIFVFWLSRIILIRFMAELSLLNGSVMFYPEFSTWLLNLSTDTIILWAIWAIGWRK